MRGGVRVLCDHPLDGIPAERVIARAWEDDLVRPRVTLGEPSAQDSDRLSGERRAAFLATLTLAADMGAGAEDQVLDTQGRDL